MGLVIALLLGGGEAFLPACKNPKKNRLKKLNRFNIYKTLQNYHI